MSQCLKCGANFVKPPEWKIEPQVCRYCQVEILETALNKIALFPVHSEPIGAALAMQDIAQTALKEIVQPTPPHRHDDDY